MRYVQLTQIEAVFSELGIRPIHHQLEHRADAHILVAFLAYCLQVTLKHRLLVHAPGLTWLKSLAQCGVRCTDGHSRVALLPRRLSGEHK
jgi:hypothetical protein